MGFHDWPLVIFSLLAQLSVGSFVALGVIRLVVKDEQRETDLYRKLDVGWIGGFIVMAVALIVSLTHLGSPLNAPRTVLNFGSAWLSREILFALLFAGFSGFFALFRWRQIGSRSLRTVLFALGAAVGLTLIFCMSMIYRYIETQPAWNTPWTTVMFYMTAGLLGCLAVGALIVTLARSAGAEAPTDAWAKILRDTMAAALVFVGLDVLAYFFYLLGLYNGVTAAQETAASLLNAFGVLFYLRVLFVLAGGVFAGLVLSRLSKSETPGSTLITLAYSAFVLALASEVISRFLFYAANVRIGI